MISTSIFQGFRAAAVAVAAVTFATLAQSAVAAPILPTTDLPASSAVAHTIDRPTGQTWVYTGGTYAFEDPTQMIAARSDGIVEKYSIQKDGSGNVIGATSLGSTDTGISDLQDIVAAPGGYVGVAGKILYFFDKDLTKVSNITLSGVSDTTDAHVYITLDSSANVPGLVYAIIFSTLTDDIRRLTNKDTGASVKIADGTTYSVGGMDLDRAVYTNNLFVSSGDLFRNLGDDGNPLSGTTFVDMNNPATILGDTFGDGYFAEMQWDRIELHNPLGVQNNQKFAPEPATLALLALGALALVARRSKDRA